MSDAGSVGVSAAGVSENYQLKWHSFGQHLHASVAGAFHSDAFTDVCLLTTDGHHLNAHRFVLSACSHYLQRVFRHQIHQRPHHPLPLLVVMPPEITYRTLRTLVQYMYCGETTVSNDILENVLRGGDILQVRGLWRPPSSKERPPDRPPDSAVNNQHQPSALKTPVIVLPKPQPRSSTEKKEKRPHPEETTPTSSHSSIEGSDNRNDSNNKDNFLVIKQEPVEWNEYGEGEMSDGEMFHTEMTIKPEIIFPTEGTEEEERPVPEEEEGAEGLYTPLTCELCAETFMLPADWVRHIRTHTDMQPAKRQRRGRHSAEEEDDDTFPPLQCDLCQKQFPTPGDWVRHIQSTHTDKELAQSNSAKGSTTNQGGAALSGASRAVRPVGLAHKQCGVCNKKFPSHASMLIHRRTHTGERPFVCDLCHKGFNVKSNLLRHLRTLHDKIIASTDVADSAPPTPT